MKILRNVKKSCLEMILDTSFLIDLMNGDRATLRKLHELKKEQEELNITSLTAYELYLGVQNSNRPSKERQKIRETIQKVSGSRIAFGWSHGKKSAEIQKTLKENGEMIELQDIFISSVASKSSQKVLTGNPEHFKKVEGIEVESY